MFRCECLKDYYSELPPMEQDIWNLHFRLGKSWEQVGYEVGYSRASIYLKIKQIKDELLVRVRKIELDIYNTKNIDKDITT